LRADYVFMGLFKRNKQATERVQDLKNRVESLRKIDEHRALTLDDFLAGDDAITSRSEPRFTPAASEPPPEVPHNDLDAELQRYLRTHADDDLEGAEHTFDEVVAAPGFEQSAPRDDAPAAKRPISIDEFPPLPSLPEQIESAPPTSPPRLSADEEAALIAELQRYLSTDHVEGEGNQNAPGDVVGFDLDESPVASEWSDSQSADFPGSEPQPALFSHKPADEASAVMDDAGMEPESETRLVELHGRTYEEPKPRHWPSTPLQPEPTEATDQPAPQPPGRPRAVGDWEPL
jgi:hypothetical protein